MTEAVQNEEDDSDNLSADELSDDFTVFTVEQTPLNFIRDRGNYNADPRSKKVSHTPMSEIAVHSWKNGLSKDQMLKRIDYNDSSEIASTMSGWTNIMDSVPRVPKDEVLTTYEVHDNGKKVKLRP